MTTAPPEWDFSVKQWARVLASMQGLERADPNRSKEAWAREQGICATNPAMPEGAGDCPDWLGIARDALTTAVRLYLSSTDLERAPAARIAKWKKVEAGATELRTAMRRLEDPRDKAVLDREVSADELLLSIEAVARAMMRSLRKKSNSAIERRPASKVLHRELFRVWTFMGGELKGQLGYRQMNNEPRGPLILFVQAVMRPTLGKPVAAETIRHWVDDEENLRAEEKAALREHTASHYAGRYPVDLVAAIRAAAKTVPAFKEEFARLEIVQAIESSKILRELHGDAANAADLKGADQHRFLEELRERMKPHREAMFQRLGFRKSDFRPRNSNPDFVEKQLAT